jgi:hypothetical protein
MARFSSAPVTEVIPKRKTRQPSQRAALKEQYRSALRDAVLERREALIVALDPDDKPLTIRNRITRAAEELGIEGLSVRRRGDRIVAYRSDGEAPDERGLEAEGVGI